MFTSNCLKGFVRYSFRFHEKYISLIKGCQKDIFPLLNGEVQIAITSKTVQYNLQ